MIEYIKGDLFTTDFKHIAHGCNCQGIMGSGVAKIVRERYPACFMAYHDYVQHHMKSFAGETPPVSTDLLGKVHVWQGDKTFVGDNAQVIFNCFTQDLFGEGKRQVNYEALAQCFEFIARYFAGACAGAQVAMPKIGAGLGGGDWEVIEAIIKSTLCKNGVRVKVYEI